MGKDIKEGVLEIHQNNKDMSEKSSESKRNKIWKCIITTKEISRNTSDTKRGVLEIHQNKKGDPRVRQINKREIEPYG